MEERLSSVSFSLSKKYLDYIQMAGTGKNDSAKLRSILDLSISNCNVIARYKKESLEEGDFEPFSVLKGGFIVYQESPEGWSYGEDLPFETPKRRYADIGDLVADVNESGFLTQLIDEPDYRFKALWAIEQKTTDKACGECKKKLMQAVKDVLQ
jgi:hypothetical protein